MRPLLEALGWDRPYKFGACTKCNGLEVIGTLKRSDGLCTKCARAREQAMQPARDGKIRKVYLAGPMRGIPLYNFPAFDEAATRLRGMGLEVSSPADLDREIGFDPALHVADHAFLRRAFARDIAEMCGCDAIALLPGWDQSKGARCELEIGKIIGLAVLDAMTGENMDTSVLAEATRLVYGPRQKDYGHPADDFARTAGMWTAMFGWSFSAEDVGLAMMAVKISRYINSQGNGAYHRDSVIDIAGYAATLDRIERRRRHLE